MAERIFDFNAEDELSKWLKAEDDLSKWLKALDGNEGAYDVKSSDKCAFVFKHVTPYAKYVYSKGSNGVFHGNQYIGQGVLNNGTLIVNQYKPVTCQNFALSHITNKN